MMHQSQDSPLDPVKIAPPGKQPLTQQGAIAPETPSLIAAEIPDVTKARELSMGSPSLTNSPYTQGLYSPPRSVGAETYIELIREAFELRGVTKGNAVITGAGGALGAAFGKILGRLGWNVAVTDYDLQAAEVTAARISREGGKTFAYKLDVGDALAWARFRDHLRQGDVWGGKVDLLINAAGVIHYGSCGETPAEVLKKQLLVNQGGVMFSAVLLDLLMSNTERDTKGFILNVGSVAGLLSVGKMGPYSSTKAGVQSLSYCWHEELKSEGINVSVITPYYFRESNLIRNGVQEDRDLASLHQALMATSTMTAQTVAERGLLGVALGKRQINPGWEAKTLFFAERHLPRSLGLWILNNLASPISEFLANHGYDPLPSEKVSEVVGAQLARVQVLWAKIRSLLRR